MVAASEPVMQSTFQSSLQSSLTAHGLPEATVDAYSVSAEPTDAASEDDSSGSGAIVGILIGSVAFALLVGGTIAYIPQCRQWQRRASLDASMAEPELQAPLSPSKRKGTDGPLDTKDYLGWSTTECDHSSMV